MANVSIRSISKSYDVPRKKKKRLFNLTDDQKLVGNQPKNAVTDLNIEIPDGNFTVIIGPSGCGKSTTLRMIAGLESIDEGEIYIGDRKVNDLSPGDRNISMVFQSYALYPMMTVKQNITFGLENDKLNKDEIENRVATVAEIVGLEEFLDRLPSQLSGGQRQRVALARSIVKNPDVYVFDEPLSNLDARLRTDMRSQLISMHKRLKGTFIYVTHDQIEAMAMADQIVILDKGFIKQIGTPQQVYHDPDNIFVAQFIGNPGMNLISRTNKEGFWGFRGEECELQTEEDPQAQVRYRLNQNHDSLDLIENFSAENNHCYSIESKVVTEEYMGSEILYTVENIFGIQKIISKELLAKPSGSVFLTLSDSNLYYFDGEGDRVREGNIL